MKLRNKRTGEVTDNIFVYDGLVCVDVWKGGQGTYATLAELNADWEDAKPAKPLIKDEKIRKAVRAWAEACGAKQIKYSIAPNQYYDADMGTGFSIKFLTKPVEVYLEEGKNYTIAELCGEIACEPVKEMDGWRKNERPNKRRKTNSR